MRKAVDTKNPVDFWDIVDPEWAQRKARGKADLLYNLLFSKFGSVPEWATQKIIKATPARIDLWLTKVWTRKTIEGIIGKKDTRRSKVAPV